MGLLVCAYSLHNVNSSSRWVTTKRQRVQVVSQTCSGFLISAFWRTLICESVLSLSKQQILSPPRKRLRVTFSQPFGLLSICSRRLTYLFNPWFFWRKEKPFDWQTPVSFSLLFVNRFVWGPVKNLSPMTTQMFLHRGQHDLLMHEDTQDHVDRDVSDHLTIKVGSRWYKDCRRRKEK